jgi:hypothetical protein
VERQREHGRVVAKDRCRAVALVHIEIDHQDAQEIDCCDAIRPASVAPPRRRR